jgi:hypothetical protein
MCDYIYSMLVRVVFHTKIVLQEACCHVLGHEDFIFSLLVRFYDFILKKGF